MNEPTKITYIASNGATQFYFNFCVWGAADVRVKKNGIALAAGADYSITLNPMPSNPNFGHEGGSISLTHTTNNGDEITIYRRLTLTRDVAYQPTLPIAASTLNMDLNYCMESLKDFNSRIDDIPSLGESQTLVETAIALKNQATTLLGQAQSLAGNATNVMNNIHHPDYVLNLSSTENFVQIMKINSASANVTFDISLNLYYGIAETYHVFIGPATAGTKISCLAISTNNANGRLSQIGALYDTENNKTIIYLKSSVAHLSIFMRDLSPTMTLADFNTPNIATNTPYAWGGLVLANIKNIQTA